MISIGSPAAIAASWAWHERSIEQNQNAASSTVSPTHNAGDGQPVPSRHASRDELVALAGAIRDLPGTTLEFLPGVGEFTDEQKALMTDLSLAAKRPLATLPAEARQVDIVCEAGPALRVPDRDAPVPVVEGHPALRDACGAAKFLRLAIATDEPRG